MIVNNKAGRIITRLAAGGREASVFAGLEN
jgi:hypothetical protein